MSDKQQVYETFMGAFYRLPFTELLGEKDMPEGRTGWYHVGEKPKDMRVAIVLCKDREAVLVRAEWRNYFADGRSPLKGEQTFTLPCYSVRVDDLQKGTEDIVVRVLELYKQVLSEDGVAGKISDLVESAPEGTDEN